MLMGSNEPHRLGDWMSACSPPGRPPRPSCWRRRCFTGCSAGRAATIAVERLMGMLLVAISVQMLMDGLTAYLKSSA